MFILCACNIEARRAFFACNLCSRFHHCSRLSSLPSGSILCSLAFLFLHTFTDVCVYLLPCLCLKHLQRSFQTVFRAVLSGLFVWCVHLHRLPYFVRLYGLICGKFAVFAG